MSVPAALPRSRRRMRVAAATILGILAAAALVGGCSAAPQPVPAAGCGVLSPRLLAGLVGPGATSTEYGSLATLRRDGTPAVCRTHAAAGRPARTVVVRAVRHPAPLPLPALECDQGWVYAGTPDKYVPACQQSVGRGGRTVLLARWGVYVVRVTIAREDRSWGGDPELGLALSEDVARRLGVRVPPSSGHRSGGASSS